MIEAQSKGGRWVVRRGAGPCTKGEHALIDSITACPSRAESLFVKATARD